MSKKTPPRKKYYIQPEDLREEIAKYQESGIASEKLGEMLIQIATGLAASSKFDKRTYRDDMAGDAVLRMYKNLSLIDTTDPCDLQASALRDYTSDAKVYYSKTPFIDEDRYNNKNTDEYKKCIITNYEDGSDVCTISLYKMEKYNVRHNKVIDKEEYKYRMIITEVLEDVPLENILFKKINPFSYLTMIAYRVYLSRCDKENRKSKALEEYRESCYSDFEITECISNRSFNESDNESDNDVMFDAIELTENII